MINFSNVSKGYGDRPLFSGAIFTLGRGERWGIVGRNGSGKSTLFRLITGAESADHGVISKPKHYRIGALEQHISFSEKTILGETLLSLPIDERDQAYRAEIILTGLGFSLDAMDQDPHSLSGGFQLRVQLAKVLLAEPDCLLLDEPTNYLDIVAIRWLEDFLKQWPGELMLISHDKAFIDRIVTHTLGIYRKQVRKLPGNTEKFYEQMLAEEEIHEKTRERTEKKRAHLKSYIERFGAKASKAAQAKSKEKALGRLPVMERLAAMENLAFSFKMAPFPSKRMLEVDHLSFTYENSDFSIDDFSLHIQKGDRIAIIGKNGRGKSTLLSLLSGELKAKSATWWKSDNLKIGTFGQTHIQRLHPEMTVEDEISCANRTLSIGEVKSLCGLMMFSGDLASKTVSVLSGGEKSRVLLGKILATPCNVLLLDEPTHHLDMESVEALLLAITHFPGAVIMVTHNEEILSQFASRLVICKEEGIHLFEDTYPIFLEKEGWEPGDIKPSKKPKETKNSRKDMRIERATHTKKIKQCERAIVKAEETLAREEKLLEKALESGDGQAIAKHSERFTALQTKIDALFQELEALS